MNRTSMALLLAAGCISGQALIAQQPAPKAPASNAAADTNPFGIKPAGITSEEMRSALSRLQVAGQFPGRRGSLTFFRWSKTEPPKLTHVGLWGEKIDDELLSLVAHFPDLENLSLQETNVTDAGLGVLTKLTKLRILTIAPITRYEKAGYGPPQWSYPFMPKRADRPRISGKFLAGLPQLTNLDSLDLLDVQLEARDLASLAKCARLSSLSLPHAIDAATIEHLQNCRRLSSLTLGHREITAAELSVLATWKSLCKLTLVHAKLSDAALEALAQLPSVEELFLEDCGLNDERLQHLRGSPKLTHLGLERNEIDGPGLKHLVPLKLRELGLEFNNLNDQTLSHLQQLGTLELLGLSYCRQVTNCGIASGQLQAMQHLRELRIRGIREVNDEALPQLARFGHLEHLNIRQSGISTAGAEELRKQLPKTDLFK